MTVTGLFFGSFDPIHTGHIAIAHHMMNREGIDEVWFVVSPLNPFKLEGTLSDAGIRLKMVESALEGQDNMKALDIELNMPQPSYTYDTLRALVEEHTEREFILIMGSDNFATFRSMEESGCNFRHG